MNDKKAPRHVPIITGFLWITISIALLFWHPEGFLYYIKILVGGSMLVFGIYSLKVGFFASDEEIKLRVTGLSDKEIRNRLNKIDSKKS
jgi:hypothetical protein